MKKLFLLLFALTCISFSSYGQALQPSTYYWCKVNTTSNNEFYFYFWVNSYGEVRQLNYAENTFKVFDKYGTVSNKNSTVYTWANAGGVWSETQTFIFTKDVTSGKIYMYYFRAVQNEGQEPWEVLGVSDDVKTYTK